MSESTLTIVITDRLIRLHQMLPLWIIYADEIYSTLQYRFRKLILRLLRIKVVKYYRYFSKVLHTIYHKMSYFSKVYGPCWQQVFSRLFKR